MPGYNAYSTQAAQADDLKKKIYFLSASAIFPQPSFTDVFASPVNYTGDKLNCVEPDYSKYVDPKLIRRMSRIIKMGVAAASEALQQAGLKNPDAIITGTAYGCLADTDQFLTRMVEFKETLLSPTAFIQSTHNTVAAQIALMLQCHHYNNTYVHRGFSFESALTDALSLIEEGDAENILVGAADEITDKSHAILKRFGLYKKESASLQMINSNTKGTMAGEGAAFFVMSSIEKNALAELNAFKNFYKPADIDNCIQSFFTENQIGVENIDLIVMGNNGDAATDLHYNEVKNHFFANNQVITYKQFCGEYPTSSAFAIWMAVNILKQKEYNKHPVKNILVYNNYLLNYPSLYLLSAC